jgi:hypothetical protein
MDQKQQFIFSSAPSLALTHHIKTGLDGEDNSLRKNAHKFYFSGYVQTLNFSTV